MNTNEMIYGYTLASKAIRATAFIIDVLLVFLVTECYYIFIEGKDFFDSLDQSDYGFFEIIRSSIISFVMGAIVYPFFSGSIGHRLVGIKVIDQNTGKDFNKFYEGGIREFLKTIFSNIIIPVIWLLFDKKRQNVYDKITKTYTVTRKSHG